MMQYRAVRFPDDQFWHIEEFDTEFQIAYRHLETLVPGGPGRVQKFIDKSAAEGYIRSNLIKNEDKGEVGEWIYSK
jgi:hypothetical protein